MTSKNGLFNVGQFAKLAGVSKATLLYYDKIGLISPKVRKENHYRYYSGNQLGGMNVIRIGSDLGMSLEEIQDIKEKRTPDIMSDVIGQYIEAVSKRIEELSDTRRLLRTFEEMIDSVRNIDENAITIERLPTAVIAMGEMNDFDRDLNDYGALRTFLLDMEKKHPHMSRRYPVWAFFSEDQIKRGVLKWPERFYFYNPDGHNIRPAGIYAIGYTRGGYGQHEELFHKVLAYIDKNGFEVCGDAYVEYPLNEAFIADETNYLLRLLINVRKKDMKR